MSGGASSSGTAAARPHAWRSAAADRIVEGAIRGVGADIAALRIPKLGGVVLGGGYGRGEGGVFEGPEAGGVRLSNDLDFYVVSEEGVSARELDAIGAALEPVGEKWTAALGVDVDFCVRTPWRLRHDQERMMVQELVRGFFDVAGRSGDELFRGVERRAPEALPWSEAVRLMMNRGAGLLWAKEEGRDANFVVRNLVKCILGAGDARLVARGEYRWAAEERGKALGDALYAKALAWKFRPDAAGVCDWETARAVWLAAAEEVRARGRSERKVFHAARWIARRGTVGEWRTFALDPVVRIFRAMERTIRERKPFPDALRKDWAVFN